jgi:hypothetical protein
VHELAANAIRHGAGHGRLLITEHDGAWHCRVTDDGTPHPAPAATASGIQTTRHDAPGPARKDTGCGWSTTSRTGSTRKPGHRHHRHGQLQPRPDQPAPTAACTRPTPAELNATPHRPHTRPAQSPHTLSSFSRARKASSRASISRWFRS